MVESGNHNVDQLDGLSDGTTKLYMSKKDTPFVYFCAITASLLVFTGCSSIVWSSPVIPKLKSTNDVDNPLGKPISPFETSLITGLPSFVAILGNIIFAQVPNAVGRKNSLLLVSLGMMISLVVIAFGRHVYVYSAGLCFLFICVAGVYVVLPLYLSEISEPHNRGRILSLIGVLMPLGNLYGYVLGPLTSVRNFTLLLTLPLVIHSIVVYLVLPESPVYLISKNNIPAALVALISLRRNKNVVRINEDCRCIEYNLKSRENNNQSGLMALFKNKSVRRALLISLGINLTQQLSGVISILKFLAPIFNNVSSSFSGNNLAVMVAVIKFISFFLSTVLVEKCGRKPLLLISSFGSCISLFLIGIYFFLQNNDSNANIATLSWLPLSSVLLFNFMYALGIGTLSITVMNELFPVDVRAAGCAFVFTVCYLLGASQVFLFPLISEYYGVQYCIWSFSFFCFMGFTFMCFMLPETKGKSYADIQILLNRL
ncbi:facilitated trehalose transporter Tret1-like [Diorhabda carinulata]|uniref:facilitated trehalose transporter Tret1-like n=1 Tax=Diorhabda carinulata TaxID=1163345 RepID=UPI0025A28F5C|nr:facilitated trehalose transporter Tret1-like [Diorhabda carinulata]